MTSILTSRDTSILEETYERMNITLIVVGPFIILGVKKME